MKRTLTFVIAVMILSFCSIAFGQTISLNKAVFGDRSYYTQLPSTLLDSTNTYYSEPFTLNGWDQGLSSSNPIRWTRLLSSTKGKPRINCVIYGSNDIDASSEWDIVDTLNVNGTKATPDSLETHGGGTTYFKGKAYAYYRFKIEGKSGNRSDVYGKYELYLPYRREN